MHTVPKSLEQQLADSQQTIRELQAMLIARNSELATSRKMTQHFSDLATEKAAEAAKLEAENRELKEGQARLAAIYDERGVVHAEIRRLLDGGPVRSANEVPLSPFAGFVKPFLERAAMTINAATAVESLSTRKQRRANDIGLGHWIWQDQDENWIRVDGRPSPVVPANEDWAGTLREIDQKYPLTGKAV